MDTEIRFLQILEDDFLELAEANETQTTARAKRRRRGTWIGAVAGIAVLAFGIGTLTGGGLLGQQARRAADTSSINIEGRPQLNRRRPRHSRGTEAHSSPLRPLIGMPAPGRRAVRLSRTRRRPRRPWPTCRRSSGTGASRSRSRTARSTTASRG